ncbi:MAG TPA: hypothetical protein ENK55_07410 [Actinobacteria bacterium]|nr:hypothetical protein [Actinomycetota bacterium]
MRRLLVIGATVLALGATAATAWAGTGTVAVDGSSELDPIVARVLNRFRRAWQWTLRDGVVAVVDAAHDVAEPLRDRVGDGAHDRVRDRAREVVDLARDVADPLRDRVADRRVDHHASGDHPRDCIVADRGTDLDCAHDRARDRRADRATDHRGGDGNREMDHHGDGPRGHGEG